MTINPIPLDDFPRTGRPWNNITPFTYRDGLTYLEVLEALRYWIRHSLVEHLNGEVGELVESWNKDFTDFQLSVISELSQKFEELDLSFDALEARINADFNSLRDQLNGQITAELARWDGEFETFTQYIDGQVELWLGSQITANDAIVSLLIADENTEVRQGIEDIFTEKIPNTPLTNYDATIPTMAARHNEYTIDLWTMTPANYNAETDVGDDDTDALERAIAICADPANRYTTINLGNRAYKITRPIHITTPVSIIGDVPSGSGFTGNLHHTGRSGSQLVDCRPDLSDETPFIQYGNADGDFMQGFVLQDFIITSRMIPGNQNAYPNRDGLYMMRCGLEWYTNRLRINRFRGSGLYLDKCFDGYHVALSISSCGDNALIRTPHSESLQRRYALQVTSNLGDTTNANHFYGLHIEGCRTFILIDRARHIHFIGGKLESNNYTAISGFDNQPESPVNIATNALEIVFTSMMFVGSHVGLWQSMNTSDDAATYPYLISSSTRTTDPRATIKFLGCSFTNGMETEGAGNVPNPSTGTDGRPKRGTKWLNGNGFHVESCVFDFATSEGTAQGTAFNVAWSTLTNNKIVVATKGHGVDENDAAIMAIGYDSRAVGNTFVTDKGTVADQPCRIRRGILVNRNAVSRDNMFELTNIAEQISGNGIAGTVPGSREVTTVSADWHAERGLSYTLSGLTLRMEYVTGNVVIVPHEGAMTIASIGVSGVAEGRSITLYNDSADTLTASNTSTQEAINLAGYRSVELVLINRKWRVR